jgi:hypothetical protein
MINTSPFWALMENDPWLSVVVPRLVPLIVTDTFGIGELSSASFTVPEIIFSCAVRHRL